MIFKGNLDDSQVVAMFAGLGYFQHQATLQVLALRLFAVLCAKLNRVGNILIYFK